MSKGGGGTPAATTQTTTTEFPSELRPYITDILERAKGQAEREEEQGYQAYTGPRIAEFEPEQLAAQQGVREFVGRGVAASPGLSSAQTYYTPALGLTLGQAEQFGAPQAAQYMSPYQQAVIDVEKREAARGFAPQMQQIGAQAARAGAFGGSRQAILEAEAGRNLQRQLGDIQTRGLQSAYDRAQAAFEAQKARERGAAGALSQMGAAIPAQALKEIGALQSLGSERQQMAQRALDLGYSQFREEQMFPTRSLQEYQSIIRGFPFTPSTYSASSYIAPPSSLAQNVLGIGTGIAGLAGAFGGFKEGGTIRLQEAGKVIPRTNLLEGSQAQKEWDAKYGKTHNPDGTLKGSAPAISGDPSMDESATDDDSFWKGLAKIIPGGGGDPEAGDFWTAPIGGQEKADELKKDSQAQEKPSQETEQETTVITEESTDTVPSIGGKALDDFNLKASERKGNRLSNLEDLLETTLEDIKGREVLTPEMKALRGEYATMLEDIPQRRREREEELKKQKYLQLAEFGRGLLGADTTKGLLAQIAQAGEKPLAEVGRLVGEAGELEDKERAERLGILGKQAEISQAEQTGERQKTADVASIAKSLINIQEARNEAAGIDSQIPESVIMGIVDRSSVGSFTKDSAFAPKIQNVISGALSQIQDEITSGILSDNNMAVRNRMQEILPPMLEALNTDAPEAGQKATPGSGNGTAGNKIDDLYDE